MSFLLTAMLAASPVFDDCRIGESAVGPRLSAECATLSVAENPQDPEVRRIDLAIARLKTLSGDEDAAPLLFIAGGPGQSAIESFPGVAAAFQDVRRDRDILLIDQRGTGGSNGLQCPALADADETEFDAERARAAARECVRELDADLRYYTTLDAVRDIESVRQALGYEKLALYGISYGTRVAQEYLRRHPEQVDAVVLDGVTVPGETLGPEIAADAQRALELMFARCEASQPCMERFPELARKFQELQARLEQKPATVTIRDPFTGAPSEVALTWPRAAMLLRMYSYAPETVSLLPLLVNQAWQGDWQGFAGSVVAMERQAETLLYIGMHNSVICSEDAPWFAAAEAEEPAYLGTLSTDMIAAVCKAWPTRELPQDFRERVKSDVPALLLSGEADPVTPPQNAAAVAEGLSNARHLVAPGQGHGVAWRGCAPKLVAEFLSSRGAGALEADCLQDLAASPFFIDRNGPRP